MTLRIGVIAIAVVAAPSGRNGLSLGFSGLAEPPAPILAAPLASAASTSRLMMRPSGPEPRSAPRSMRLAVAMREATGDTRMPFDTPPGAPAGSAGEEE